MVVFFVLFLLGGARGNRLEEKAGLRKARDSYLDAYKATHEEGVHEENRRKSNQNSAVKENGFTGDSLRPEFPYPSSHHYPDPSYGAPQGYPNYGPPAHHYGPPPPVHHDYGIPYALLGIFDKFKLKLNILTILKLLLKLVLFKKFVSFVGILCLLLFIPWIKAKKAFHHHVGGGGGAGGNGGAGGGDYDDEDEDDLMRKVSSRSNKGQEKLNQSTRQVLESIEKFSKKIQ